MHMNYIVQSSIPFENKAHVHYIVQSSLEAYIQQKQNNYYTIMCKNIVIQVHN